MADFYKPGKDANHRESDAILRAEQDAELNQFSTFRGENPLDVREREEAGVSPKVPNHRQMTEGQRQSNRKFNQNVLMGLFTSKKLRKKSSLMVLLLLLFGGGGFMTVFLSPSLAIVHMKEVLTSSLNDQMHDIEERSAVLMRSKLKDLTKGSCGAIKIKCQFTTITEKQAAKFKAAGIEVKIDDNRTWYNNKRGQITEISYTDPNSKATPVVIKDAASLQKTLLSADNAGFRASMLKGYNPLFAGLTDNVMLSVLRGFKATKGLVITGKDDEERQRKVNDMVSGVEDSHAKTITTKTDEDGKERYFDSDGNELTKEQVDGATKSAGRIATYIENGGYKNMLTNAAKGANALAYVDTGCTVFNSVRMVSALAKTIREAQAARYAMAMALTPPDSLKAGDLQEQEMNFVSNTFSATRASGNAVDESKILLASSSEPIPVTADKEAGMTAYDSPGYRMAAYNEVPEMSLRASQFMLGGTTNLFNESINYVTKAIAGTTDPQRVSEMCGYVQNPVVRITGLAIGVAAGIGTFGVTTALSMGGSLAIGMLLPYVEAQAADMVAGNVFKDISGIDSGDAAVAGSIALFGGVAKKRGSKPLSSQEALQMAAANQKTYNEYAASQRYLARNTPLDASNPYSFMGSVVGTMIPALQKSKTSASMAMMSVASLIPTSFAKMIPSASAADVTGGKPADFYEQCNDIGYKRLGLGADKFCGVHYALMSDLDPIENVDWMLANNEINPDTGDAKPEGGPLTDGRWSYAKFLRECADRTVGWGENQDENQGDGLNCVSGENEPKNVHYRTYTFDRSINDTLDGEPVAAAGSSTNNSQSNASNPISTDGWAYPTSLDFTVTSGFESAERPNHHGVDIAGSSSAVTLGSTIYAAYGGKVVKAGPADGYGHWIVIESDINGQKISTVYGHMYADGLKVKEGDIVKAGDPIGKIGSDGDSTGPHLHFEVWNGSPLSNGKQRDPMEFLDAAKKAKEVINV